MEQEEAKIEYDNDAIITAVPEKKKRTLTEKQIKNLQAMREKKMIKKKAEEMINATVRNSARETEKSQRKTENEEEIINLKKELYELKKKVSEKRNISSSPKNIPNKRKKIEDEDNEDNGEYGTYQSVNPYLIQLVRGR